jgi:hypothetical protein
VSTIRDYINAFACKDSKGSTQLRRLIAMLAQEFYGVRLKLDYDASIAVMYVMISALILYRKIAQNTKPLDRIMYRITLSQGVVGITGALIQVSGRPEYIYIYRYVE